MHPPRRIFTAHENDASPVAYILANVAYMYDSPIQYSPEQIHALLGERQYMWGTGVELTFLRYCGLKVQHWAMYNPYVFMQQQVNYIRGRVAPAPSYLNDLNRQQVVQESVDYFARFGEELPYIPRRPVQRTVISALLNGMVVDLAWWGKELEAMAALAYGMDENNIKLYCPYWDKEVFRTVSMDEFITKWRSSFGINIYGYMP